MRCKDTCRLVNNQVKTSIEGSDALLWIKNSRSLRGSLLVYSGTDAALKGLCRLK